MPIFSFLKQKTATLKLSEILEGDMENGKMMQCFPSCFDHRHSTHYHLKRARGNCDLFWREYFCSSFIHLIFSKLKNMERHYELKFSRTCKCHREQRWQLIYSLHKCIFFFFILKGAQAFKNPEPDFVLPSTYTA